MDSADSKSLKLCIFCHAQVAMELKVCPFCRASFDKMYSGEEKSEPIVKKKILSPNESITSLYPPPYQPKMEKIEEEIESKQEEVIVKKSSSNKLSLYWPILLFSIGMQLLVLGFFLLLFSKEGSLFLRWNSHFWYLYIILSLPMLGMGYKLFSNVEQE